MLVSPSALFGALDRAGLAPFNVRIPLEAIGQLDEKLPASMTEGCLEVSLRDGIDPDIWMTIPFDEGGREATRSFLENHRSPHESDWQRTYELLEVWACPTAGFATTTGDLFLEFDAPRPYGVPIVVAGLRTPGRTISANVLAVIEQLQATADIWFDRSVIHNLQAIEGRLPETASFRNFCVVNRSSRQSLRAVVWMNVLSVNDFCAANFSGCDANSIRRIVDAIKHRSSIVGIQFDAGRPDWVAIECAYQGGQRTEVASAALLEFLHVEGACTPIRRDMVRGWLTPHAKLYRNLIIKTAVGTQGVEGAKAYLGFSSRS